jgi:xylose isomerase
VIGRSCVRTGLDKDFKLNVETNHATLAGHSMDPRTAGGSETRACWQHRCQSGVISRTPGTPISFPYSINETVEIMLVLLRSSGATQGGGRQLRREDAPQLDGSRRPVPRSTLEAWTRLPGPVDRR